MPASATWPTGCASSGRAPRPAPTLAHLLSILSSLLVGFVLLVAPWTSLWDSNWLLQPHPVVRSVFLSAFTRGAVSGLGLVNILIALHDVRARLVQTVRRR
jgi:hypothetical protein